MAIYVVTGKLGGGKSLATVSRINEALGRGLRVATNLDLQLSRLPALSRRTRNARVVRVPDRPTVDDIAGLGFGIEGVHDLAQAKAAYDEDRFGLLVLDECGTWLNARDWQAEGRRELINFLLHIRKHLWHVYLIIQDISMLDKQARKALAEHCVYCRRMDRVTVPLLGTVSKLILRKPITFPKLHIAHVKYGDQPQSLTVDKWWYRGEELYGAFDTVQVFSEDYPHGAHSLLPPWYLFRNSFVRWTWRKRMQLTKIYFRKYSKASMLAAGLFLGVFSMQAVGRIGGEPESLGVETEQRVVATVFDGEAVPAPSTSLGDMLHVLRVASFHDDGIFFDVQFSDGELTYGIDALRWLGYSVDRVGPCAFRIAFGPSVRVVRCLGG